MAINTNSPFGFKWHGLAGDANSPNSGLIQLKIASTDTSTYGEGDPLMFVNTGYVTAFTNGSPSYKLAGVFKSCEYYSTAYGRRIWSNYYPGANNASGDVLVSVAACVGSSAVPRFLVQASGSNVLTASVFSNCDIKSGTSTAGTATGGYFKSAATIDSGAIATTSTLPWRIVGLWSDIGAPGSVGTDNTSGNSYNWVLVAPNFSGVLGV